MLADLAHERGLSIGLKNDLDQVADLVDHFDFAINEECCQYEECDAAGTVRPTPARPCSTAEYELDPADFCPDARARGLQLDAASARASTPGATPADQSCASSP